MTDEGGPAPQPMDPGPPDPGLPARSRSPPPGYVASRRPAQPYHRMLRDLSVARWWRAVGALVARHPRSGCSWGRSRSSSAVASLGAELRAASLAFDARRPLDRGGCWCSTSDWRCSSRVGLEPDRARLPSFAALAVLPAPGHSGSLAAAGRGDGLSRSGRCSCSSERPVPPRSARRPSTAPSSVHRRRDPVTTPLQAAGEEYLFRGPCCRRSARRFPPGSAAWSRRRCSPSPTAVRPAAVRRPVRARAGVRLPGGQDRRARGEHRRPHRSTTSLGVPAALLDDVSETLDLPRAGHLAPGDGRRRPWPPRARGC